MCIFMGAFGVGLANQFIGEIDDARDSAKMILS